MDGTESNPAFLPYKMGYLTDEMVAKARKELGETEEVRRKCLEELRAYVRSQKNLICPTDDVTLLSYLRLRKFDTNRAIKLVNDYFTMKMNYPEIFGAENYEALIRSAKNQFINVLPYRDHDGCCILLFKPGKWDVHETSLPLLLHFVAWLIIAVSADAATQVCGVKAIGDASGITLRHISAAHPKYLRVGALALMRALPLRVTAFHIITSVPMVKIVWNLVSPAFNEKARKRVRFHGKDGSSLAKYFDPRLLPKEYGGVLDYDNSTLINDLEARKEEYFERAHAGYR